MDTIPSLPPDSDGNCNLVVAVDVFTKWVELGAFKTKQASEIARWIESNLLARYGTPAIIRTDNGREFEGEVS